MLLEGRGPGARLRIIDGNDKVNYKPCVDITFASAAKTYGDKVLAIVLTGMGADGRDGARLLKEQGATIWAQDEASCVVYGMPQAVAKAGIASGIPAAGSGGPAHSGRAGSLTMGMLGLVLALGAVAIAQWWHGGSLLTLLDGPAFVIVVGGTWGVILQTPAGTCSVP
jgi:hypothetical protein